jgi:hypothetical protein
MSDPKLPTPLDQVAEERRFIHDLASPLAAALFIAEGLVEDADGARAADPACARKLKDAIERIRAMLQARRAILVGRAERGDREG